MKDFDQVVSNGDEKNSIREICQIGQELNIEAPNKDLDSMKGFIE